MSAPVAGLCCCPCRSCLKNGHCKSYACTGKAATADVLASATREAVTNWALLNYLAAYNPGTVLPLLEHARTDMRQTAEFRDLAAKVMGIVRATFGELADAS